MKMHQLVSVYVAFIVKMYVTDNNPHQRTFHCWKHPYNPISASNHIPAPPWPSSPAHCGLVYRSVTCQSYLATLSLLPPDYPPPRGNCPPTVPCHMHCRLWVVRFLLIRVQLNFCGLCRAQSSSRMSEWCYWPGIEKSRDAAVTELRCRRPQQQIHVSLWTFGTYQSTGLLVTC